MGVIETGEGVQIHPSAIITAEKCHLDDRTVIGENVIIEGRFVKIGKEGWLDRGAHIGGGSCFDPGSGLIAGDFLHMGVGSHINIARKVDIGDEVGIGRGTQIFTHGAYLSAFDGFPVQWGDVVIEDRVWLPHAWVNPGVTIGQDTVVSAMSLVNIDLPQGCLAGGIPVRILKHEEYPHPLEMETFNELVYSIAERTRMIVGGTKDVPCFAQRATEPLVIRVKNHPRDFTGGTIFNMDDMSIDGPVTPFARAFKDQLRRNGIRFRYKEDKDGQYVPW